MPPDPLPVAEPPLETIPDVLEWRARGASPRPWLFFEGDTWNLDDVLGEVDRMAVGLAERGVVPGDRVAILVGNHPDTIFAWFAANRLGAIAVPLNPAYKVPELKGVLELVGPRVMVVREGDLWALAESASRTLPSEARPVLAPPLDLRGDGRGAPRARVTPDDVAVLLATSGTTGTPKAVMQTHRTYALTAEAFPWWVGLTDADRLLLALPLFHINAQAYSVMGALGCGGTLALTPRFSASAFWESAKRLGATQVNLVGAMVHILLRTAAGAGDRDHGVRLCYAALALPEEQHRAFEERFGLAMTVGYGLSETTFGTVWPRGEPPHFGTMGKLRQHPRLGEINRARVVNGDGEEAGAGEPGELWLDNPAMMRGYYRDPAQTAEALAPETAGSEGPHWLRTGDIVRRDEGGYYTFVSRKKDVLRRRGENVAAAEIEGVLGGHPDVREVAVKGAPSALGEDEILAFVVAREGREIDVEALRVWARERLADYKVPSEIHVRDALPRTATERIAKHLLE